VKLPNDIQPVPGLRMRAQIPSPAFNFLYFHLSVLFFLLPFRLSTHLHCRTTKLTQLSQSGDNNQAQESKDMFYVKQWQESIRDVALRALLSGVETKPVTSCTMHSNQTYLLRRYKVETAELKCQRSTNEQRGGSRWNYDRAI
jgi:hypothetical protein